MSSTENWSDDKYAAIKLYVLLFATFQVMKNLSFCSFARYKCENKLNRKHYDQTKMSRQTSIKTMTVNASHLNNKFLKLRYK